MDGNGVFVLSGSDLKDGFNIPHLGGSATAVSEQIHDMLIAKAVRFGYLKDKMGARWDLIGICFGTPFA